MKKVIFLLLLLMLIPTSIARASGGITVTPSIIKVDLDKEEAVASVFYKNTSSSTLSLAFSAQDFTDLEDGYKVKFLNENDSKNYHYSLSSWIKFERQTLDLHPGEERELKIYIQKDRLSPGAHYGAIEAEFREYKDKPGEVGIKGVLSSLLFVRTNTGKEIDSAKIANLSIDQGSPFDFPKIASISLQNTGNTDLTPHGLLEITQGNTLVAKGVLNEDSLITLPESIRNYSMLVRKLHEPFLPGFYNAKLTTYYGKANIKEVTNGRFFYTGSIFPVLVLVIVAIIAVSYISKRIKRKATSEKKKTK